VILIVQHAEKSRIIDRGIESCAITTLRGVADGWAVDSLPTTAHLDPHRAAGAVDPTSER
jgi:hypothetical protein